MGLASSQDRTWVVWGLLFAKQHSPFVVTREESVITQSAGESLTHRSGLGKDKPEATESPRHQVVSMKCNTEGAAACLETPEARTGSRGAPAAAPFLASWKAATYMRSSESQSMSARLCQGGLALAWFSQGMQRDECLAGSSAHLPCQNGHRSTEAEKCSVKQPSPAGHRIQQA